MKRLSTWAISLSVLTALLTPIAAYATTTPANASSSPNYQHQIVVPLPAGTVFPAVPRAGTYTWNYARQCGDAQSDCVSISTHATYTSNQIWINGSMVCSWPSGFVTDDWCGFGGNGTSTLDLQMNWHSIYGNSYWFRFDIPAGSAKNCYTRGNISGIIDECKTPA